MIFQQLVESPSSSEICSIVKVKISNEVLLLHLRYPSRTLSKNRKSDVEENNLLHS
jgi:hypothetical protein